MNEKVKQITKELLEQDPTLSSHQRELEELVLSLLRARPDPAIDQQFYFELKQKLLLSIEKNRSHHSQEKRGLKDLIINLFTMKKINIAIGTAALAVIILVAGTIYLNKEQGTQTAYTPKVKITFAGDQAFGKLDGISNANTNTVRGGGGQNEIGNTADLSRPMSATEGKGGESVDYGFLPPDEAIYYRYVYSGEQIEIDNSKMQVLKRQKGAQTISDLTGMLNLLSFNLVNIGSFPNLRVQSVNFAQSGDDGYNIYVNMDEASINIYGAWPKPMEYLACYPNCPPPHQLTLADVPPDNELISAANSFTQAHGIPTSIYGQPIIQDEWKTQFEIAQVRKEFSYVPDVISVVYPLLIEDRYVYDESGNLSGLNVGINIRNKKVVSVWELNVPNFEASMYETETNAERILKFAEKGGMHGYLPEYAKKITDVELGSPRIELVKMWNYKNGQSEELLIPSFIFPVLNPPKTYYYVKKSVIVPLVKEILDKDEPPFRILPVYDDIGAGEIRVLEKQ
jgi:hypothetical protein